MCICLVGMILASLSAYALLEYRRVFTLERAREQRISVDAAGCIESYLYR